MAQAGYTPIQLYYSNTATNVPAALVNGELAINQADGKLYYRNSAGAVTQFSPSVTAVTTISFGSTGLTPNTATSGAVSVAGTLGSGYGGTGFSTYAAGDLIYASAVNTLSKLTAGTNGYVLTLAAGVPTWAASTGGVTSFSAGSTGLTPNTATTGAVTLAGTLALGYGGTGATSAGAALANLIGFTTTVASGGTTTLTNTSTSYQVFTGFSAQTVVLPVTSTLQTGWTFRICNNALSATFVTVNSSGGNLVGYVIASTTMTFTCVGTTLTTGADWEAGYSEFSGATGSGNVVLETNPVFSGTLGFNGSAASTSSFHTTQTSGVMTIGGTAGTGNIIFGRSTVSQTTSIQAGATSSGNTKTIDLGSGGLAGSTTAITIGSTAGTSTTTLNGTTTLANALAAASGGTGFSTYAAGDLIYASAVNTLSKLTAGTNGYVLTLAAGVPTWAANTGGVTSFSAGSTGLTPNTATTGAISLAGTLGSGYGGTGFSTYAAGDLIYASAVNTLAKLTAGTNGHVLTLAAGVPSWAAVPGSVTTISFGSTGLTPNTATSGAVSVAGTLGVANGGTGLTSYTSNSVLITNGSGNISYVGSSTTGQLFLSTASTPGFLSQGTTGQFLQSNGTGVSPSWGEAVTGLSFGTTGFSPSSLTNGNITVTGTLVAANGGTGFSTYATGDLIYASAANTLAKLTAGTNGYVLTLAAGVPTWAAASSGVTGFTGAQNTAVPNATNNVSSLTVSAASTNAFAAIVPKGTGGLIGAIPDSTATGGDIRGTYSVDLQFTRSASTMVASGADASLIGGASNTASSTDSSVVGGNNNNAGAAQSGIFAGANNKTTGAYSAVIGGDFGDDRGLSGALVQGAVGAATSGQYQSRRTQLVAATTDATATRMTSTNTAASSTNQLNLIDNSAFAFAGIVVAGVTAAGNAKAWNFRGLIKRGSGVGTTAIVSTVAVNIDAADAGASTWSIAVTADTTNGTLAVTATGQAATNIKWTCVITSSEVVTT